MNPIPNPNPNPIPIPEAKPSVLQLLLGEHTNANDRDKPAVAPLFTIETKNGRSNTYNNKEETSPRRIRGLYISPDDIVDGLEPDRDHAGQYMDICQTLQVTVFIRSK